VTGPAKAVIDETFPYYAGIYSGSIAWAAADWPADAGFVLGMDLFGVNLDTTFEARADTLVEMCRRGYAERMVLFHDAARYIDWMDPKVMQLMPQWNYLHIHDEFVPYIRKHGVTEDQITTMLTANLTQDVHPCRATRRGA
jgi:predicted metal-dependent phosphotriesterase family hydrolase